MTAQALERRSGDPGDSLAALLFLQRAGKRLAVTGERQPDTTLALTIIVRAMLAVSLTADERGDK